MRFLMTLAYWGGCDPVWRLVLRCVVEAVDGAISLSYLLDGDFRDPDSPTGFSTTASPGRTQALMVTLLVAGYYLLQVIHNPKELPPLSLWLVGVLGEATPFT